MKRTKPLSFRALQALNPAFAEVRLRAIQALAPSVMPNKPGFKITFKASVGGHEIDACVLDTTEDTDGA